MARIIADRVLETSTTTGTGSLTLLGAVTGYRPFSAVCANNDIVPYFIEQIDASGQLTGPWETGFGTWTTGSIFVRTTVTASSNSNTLVNFAAGTKRVALALHSTTLAVAGENAGLMTGADKTKLDSLTNGLVPTSVKTSNYTAVANELVRVNSTAGPFTVTLPSAPVDGTLVGIFDIYNQCGVNAVLVAPSGGKTVEGDTDGLSVNINSAYVPLIYNSATNNWKVAETPDVPPSILISRETKTATASQTVFVLDKGFAVGMNSISVYINGVKQFPNAYTETNANTITFAAGLTAGDVVLFETGTVTSGNINAASNVTFTPTGGVIATNVQAAIAELDTEITTLANNTASNITAINTQMGIKAPSFLLINLGIV